MRTQPRRGGSSHGSWYIGSGNKVSVFTSRPGQPFEKVRAVYGDQLERLGKGGKTVAYGSLSEAERYEIRLRVRKALKREQWKKAAILVFSVAVTLASLFGIVHLIEMKLK